MARNSGATSKRTKPIKLALVLGLLGLLVLGVFGNFIPATFLSGRQWVAPMLLTGAILTVLPFLHAYRYGRLKAVVRKGVFNTLLAIVVAPPLLGCVCWLMLARGAPWVYTRIAGVSFQEMHVMQTEYFRSGRSCKYRLSGGPLEDRFPSHLCISEALYRRHPDQQMTVVLTGQRSVLGMRIAAIEDVP
ncbi:hypothetical protein CFBP7900_33850 [Xanthomonas hortorum pv. carotae]|uniref:Uncharacterized protein n=1 Tax=Xanthomonas hortorum pv. carotae TaxID=487904 RepID=A0A6V7FCJ3_9XANT|nr:hypothetical protein XHC_1056 [Xanthomonas hortorum pv. carotae str. M081]CAD0361057.1 hypothetical protein CFBP7900_33850 [Xanthomonas hortorum pv. carotae]CAD0361059.1 hypothetical protein CFBP7900_33850 [Xanthomonas hortorum pv. carotae]